MKERVAKALGNKFKVYEDSSLGIEELIVKMDTDKTALAKTLVADVLGHEFGMYEDDSLDVVEAAELVVTMLVDNGFMEEN